jgi:hypothetical protein
VVDLYILVLFPRTWTTLATIAVMKIPRCSLEADVETLSTDVYSFLGGYPCRWRLSTEREKPIDRLYVNVRRIKLYSPFKVPLRQKIITYRIHFVRIILRKLMLMTG